jgi:small redox-active disulfide protein 2
MKKIQVLGTGCNKCVTTARQIDEIARRLNVAIDLEKVEDMAQIAAAGVMSTPAVVIDGKVVHKGGVPSRTQIEEWLSA